MLFGLEFFHYSIQVLELYCQYSVACLVGRSCYFYSLHSMQFCFNIFILTLVTSIEFTSALRFLIWDTLFSEDWSLNYVVVQFGFLNF